jgi:anti-anti-sigma regulatory factor
MSVQTGLEGVIVVDLPRELEGHNELQAVLEMIRHRGGCDVIVDFSKADVAGSLTFSRLLELRSVLRTSGHKLILCSVAPQTKGVFATVQLDRLFSFVEDKTAALASLEGCAEARFAAESHTGPSRT